MNLLIGICSNRDWKAMFGLSMIDLISTLHRKSIAHTVDGLLGTSLISAGRQKIMDKAIEGGFSHVLMIDDDMLFTGATFLTMLDKMEAEQLPLIAANYISKGPGGRPTAMGLFGDPVFSRLTPRTHEMVSTVGLGFCLIRLDVFRNMDIPRPWFEVPWSGHDYVGEDYYFCRLLNHHGIPVFVDHQASRKIGHVGDHIYREGETSRPLDSNQVGAEIEKSMQNLSIFYGILPKEDITKVCSQEPEDDKAVGETSDPYK